MTNLSHPARHNAEHAGALSRSPFQPAASDLIRVGSRRWFLQTGLAGLAGLSLPDLLRCRAQGAVTARTRGVRPTGAPAGGDGPASPPTTVARRSSSRLSFMAVCRGRETSFFTRSRIAFAPAYAGLKQRFRPAASHNSTAIFISANTHRLAWLANRERCLAASGLLAATGRTGTPSVALAPPHPLG